MKNYRPAFPRLISVPVIAFTLLLRAAVGQGTSPTGTYGYAANVYLVDSVGSNGAALLGLMSFDGAGNVSGTVTLQPRGPQGPPKAVTGNFTGTYSGNPDGTISAKLTFPFGMFSFDMVVIDGGQGLQFVSTDTYAGSNAMFQGSSPQSLSGGLPIKLFNTRLSGGISVSLTGATVTGGGPTVYTVAPTTRGTGSVQCPDGSVGTWTASMPTLTIVTNASGSSLAGDFLAAVSITACGGSDFETLSGLVTGTAGPGGATTLVLHGPPTVISGTARVAQAGGSLNGSYGVQLDFSPFPGGTIGVMQFDGAGGVTLAAHGFDALGMTTNYAGTYSLNPDGTGAIDLNFVGKTFGSSYSFVVTDGGSQLLLLLTDGNPTNDSVIGTARLQ